MAVYTVMYREEKGVEFQLWDMSANISTISLGGSDGSDMVQTTITSEGLLDASDLFTRVTMFNQMVANIRPPDSQISIAAFEARHVRILFGFKQGNDAHEWLAEVVGGIATPLDKQFGPGQYNDTGFIRFVIRHKPIFRRRTSIAQAYNTYDNTTNGMPFDLVGETGFGDSPALVDFYIQPIGSPVTMSRVYVGVGRGGFTPRTSKIADYTQKTLTVNSVAVELVGGGSSIDLTHYSSGYSMPIVRLDALPSAVSGVQISADGVRWFDLEAGHAIHRTELLKLPVSRIGSLSAAGYTLHMWARWINPAVTAGTTTTIPAGTIHLFPCDQFIDYAVNGAAITAGQELIHHAYRNLVYVNTVSTGIFDTVIARPLQGIRMTNDFHQLHALYEASDGTAPSTKAFGMSAKVWPRRRSV